MDYKNGFLLLRNTIYEEINSLKTQKKKASKSNRIVIDEKIGVLAKILGDFVSKAENK